MKVREVMTSAVITATPTTTFKETAQPPAGAGPMTKVTNSAVLDRCPGCANQNLYTVSDGEATNFLCRSCSRCWHVTMGRVHQVDPITCPGCEWRYACSSRWDVPWKVEEPS